MPSGASSAGLSSLPSSFSSSEHKSDSSSARSRALLPQPSSADPPATADQVIELSVSSEELASWRRRHQQVQVGPMPWPGRTRSVVRRYSALVPPAALLIALVVLLVQDLANAHSNADSSDLPDVFSATVMNWSVCSLDNAVANNYNLSAQCATVTLPLCYEGVCTVEDANATIAVSFKRIPAIGSNATSVSAQTVWYITDRPDLQTREEAELQMTLLYEELRGDVDIYTLDVRGSGNSTALTCNASAGAPLQAAIFARNDGVLEASDVLDCASRLQQLGYTNLSAFSLASSARDVDEVIAQFQPDSQAVVYSVGYGTLVAQQLLQRSVAQVVGYVFDGALGSPESVTGSARPETTLYQVTQSDEDFGQVAAEFLAWCQADADCSMMFSDVSSTTTLDSTLAEVYTRLDADTTSMCAMILKDTDTSGSLNSATTTTPPSYVLRQLLGRMMEDTTRWPFIPVVVYRFHRCGSEDLTLLAQFVNATFEADDDVATPDLLYAVQAFSELWETPSPDQTVLTARFTDAQISSGRVYSQLQAYCFFTGDTSAACSNTSASTSNSSGGSSLAYTMTTNTSAPAVSSGTSVLLLSGGLDAISPPRYAETLFAAYQTENKALLVAPNGTHGVVQTALLSNGTACARRVLASFVRNSGNLSAYDASCMAALPTPSLAISNASSLLILGVEDAYDGVLVVSSSNSSSGSAGVLTDRGSSDDSSSSGSALDELNRRISALEHSRHRYMVALIAVGSVLGALVVAGVVAVIYRRRQKQQLAGEEVMLRRMRGDEENEVELMRSIYLLSSSSPSSGARSEPRPAA
jgi:pimeloyl-ACP methyl ester carboxylesterase